MRKDIGATMNNKKSQIKHEERILKKLNELSSKDFKLYTKENFEFIDSITDYTGPNGETPLHYMLKKLGNTEKKDIIKKICFALIIWDQSLLFEKDDEDKTPIDILFSDNYADRKERLELGSLFLALKLKNDGASKAMLRYASVLLEDFNYNSLRSHYQLAKTACYQGFYVESLLDSYNTEKTHGRD